MPSYKQAQNSRKTSVSARARTDKPLIGLTVLISALLAAPLSLAEPPGEEEQVPEDSANDSPAEDDKKRPDLSVRVDEWSGLGGSAGALVQTPVSALYPNNIEPVPVIENPVADDPEAVARGKEWYNHYNCVGCHAPNGAGGMGPSLSNSSFVYGSEPQNIYLSILQGRPAGMPAWGGILPDKVIWDLVAYIKAISKEPSGAWGKTVSADGFTIEQVPAGFQDSLHPWEHTQPFSYGQAPFEKPKGSPPLETPKK